MTNCITCGMPFEGNHADDIGLETEAGPVCKYDSDDGKIKSGAEIFQGGVAFFSEATAGGDTYLAERLTRLNMSRLPHWQENPIPELEGEVATDDEFYAAMSKL